MSVIRVHIYISPAITWTIYSIDLEKEGLGHKSEKVLYNLSLEAYRILMECNHDYM